MTRLVRVGRKTLVEALVKREAISIVEGKPPRVAACEWCGKLLSGRRGRKPPRFCRGGKCASKADAAEQRSHWRIAYLIGPVDFEAWMKWQREVGGR